MVHPRLRSANAQDYLDQRSRLLLHRIARRADRTAQAMCRGYRDLARNTCFVDCATCVAEVERLGAAAVARMTFDCVRLDTEFDLVR
jgi:hypothetical protein